MDIYEQIVQLRREGWRGAVATITNVRGSIPSFPLRCPMVSGSRENDETICRNDNAGGSLQTMHGGSGCRDASVVTCNHGINPVVVNIAVEDLRPLARPGETHGVVVPGGFGKRGDNNHVLASAFQPAMKGYHAI